MKEQHVEVGRSAVDYSVGQRPIHDTYEPPNPIPQFRQRPKLHQAQPPIKRPAYSVITKRTNERRFAAGVHGYGSEDGRLEKK